MDASPSQKSYQHNEASHLLLRQGNQLSCFVVPPHQEVELSDLCFIDHGPGMLDRTIEQFCKPKDGRFHAHLHHGELIEDIFLEACMETAGCGLGPFPWEFSDSCIKVLDDNYGQDLQDHKEVKAELHLHKEGCGHKQIRHGDHLDWLVPLTDGSIALSHGLGNESAGASEHGRLVRIGELHSPAKNQYKTTPFDLYRLEAPQTSAFDSRTDSPSLKGIQLAVAEKLTSKEHVFDAIREPLLEGPQVNINIGNDDEPVKLQRTAIDVLGICCPAEVPLIKKILEPAPGVQEVCVNVAARLVTVQHDAFATPPARLVKLLNNAHLEASIHVTGEWKAARKWPSPYTFASGLFITIALFQYVYSPLKWVALGAVVVGAPPIIWKSFQTLRRCILDINILMIIAVAGSIALGDYLEAGLIVFLFTLAEWLESRSTDRARLAISSFASLAPQSATLADTGAKIRVAEIKVGSRLAVKAGESIPIDGIVVSGRSAVDESSLTGESLPIEKEIGGRVWAGTINMTGYICVETSALAEDSAVARMIRLVEEAQNQRSHVEQLMESFAKYYTPCVILGALAFAIIPLSVHAHNIRHWLYLALVLLVVACPCALVISTPVTTTCAIAQAARVGLLVKGGKHLEALGKLKVVAMDKTGTLTEGCFQIVQVHPLDKKANLQDVLFWLSCIESKASHPLASAVVEYARLHGTESRSVGVIVNEFRILPGEGVTGIVDGHQIAAGNERLANRLHWLEASAAESALLESWKSQGLTICWVGVDGKPTLIMSAGDPLRPEAGEAVRDMRRLGLRIAMLTGDSVEVANTVQKKLGQIDVHAQLFPEDKVDIVKRLKEAGPTAMVGDGINDAPALAAADVGIAMGVAGTAMAMETADIALMTNDLRKLAVAVRLGRKARRKILQNISLSVATKVLIIVLAAVGYASLWGAVLADVGTCLLVIFNSMLLLEKKKDGSGFMGLFACGRKPRSKVCQKDVVLSGDKRGEESEPCCPKKMESDGGSTYNTKQGNQSIPSCCATKSCCDVKGANNGMRRRVSNRDPNDKDCQEVDEGTCSAINITELEALLLKKTDGTRSLSDCSQKERLTCCSSNYCTESGSVQKEQAIISRRKGGDASSGIAIKTDVLESPYNSRQAMDSCTSRGTTGQCCTTNTLLGTCCISRSQNPPQLQLKSINSCERGCCKGRSQNAEESAAGKSMRSNTEGAAMTSSCCTTNNLVSATPACCTSKNRAPPSLQFKLTNGCEQGCCEGWSQKAKESPAWEPMQKKVEGATPACCTSKSQAPDPSLELNSINGCERGCCKGETRKEDELAAGELMRRKSTTGPCCTNNTLLGSTPACCTSRSEAPVPSSELRSMDCCQQGCCKERSQKADKSATGEPMPKDFESAAMTGQCCTGNTSLGANPACCTSKHQAPPIDSAGDVCCASNSQIYAGQDGSSYACGGVMYGTGSGSGNPEAGSGCAGNNCDSASNVGEKDILIGRQGGVCCDMNNYEREDRASLPCGEEQGLVMESKEKLGQDGGCQGKSCCSATQ